VSKNNSVATVAYKQVFSRTLTKNFLRFDGPFSKQFLFIGFVPWRKQKK